MKRLIRPILAVLFALVFGVSVFWFSRPLDLKFEEHEARLLHQKNSKFADLGDLKIHYQEFGSGKPLVLIHGYGSSTYSWKDVVEPLAKTNRVIALDLKGFGFSDKPEGDYSRVAQAEVVARFLEKLRIEKAWIAGNSMGGEIAANLAIRHPDKIYGLVLIDSAGIRIPGKSSVAPWYTTAPVVGPFLTAVALTSDGIVKQGLEKSFFDDSLVTSERVAAYSLPLTTRSGQAAAIAARRQFSEGNIESKLGSISAPTLLIWGRHDEIIPLDSGERMKRLIPGSELVVLEKCGHVPQEEMPEKVVKLVTEFISEHDADSK